jgi:hypothetical protein
MKFQKHFYEDYRTLHKINGNVPDTERNVLTELEDLEKRVKVCWNDMAYLSGLLQASPAEQKVSLRTYSEYSIALKEAGKLIWLFDQTCVPSIHFDKEYETFSHKMREVILQENNIDLSINDCILLTYLTYQNEYTLGLTEGLSLSLIRDMFEPVADANLNAWRGRHNA